MSFETLFAQTARETPFTPMRETCIVPTLLPVCCLFEFTRDDTIFSPGRDRWMTHRTYRETHGVNPAEFALTHAYCPKCFTKVQEDTAQQNFRQIGTSP